MDGAIALTFFYVYVVAPYHLYALYLGLLLMVIAFIQYGIILSIKLKKFGRKLDR